MSVSAGDRWASGAAYEGYIGRWSRLVAPEFVDWLAQPAGLRWLDVGCGTGILTRTILEQRPGLRGRHRSGAAVRRPCPGGGRRREGDLPCRQRRSDGCDDSSSVVAGSVFNFVPDIGAAMAEALRVVRRGGLVAGYVWDYAGGMELLRRFFDAAIALDPGMRARDEGVRFPITQEGRLAAAFEAAGLVEVDHRPIDVPTVFRDFDDLWTRSCAVPARRPRTSSRSTSRAGRRCATGLVRAEEPDGSIRLTARAWAVRGRSPGGSEPGTWRPSLR